MTTQALILAAGRGSRMRPLTDTTPKPLLCVQGRPLIVWHLERLARAGITQVVINAAWLEEQFEPLLGDGSRFGVSIRYSLETAQFGRALETAGGIATALPLLAKPAAPFWLVAGDVFAPDFGFDAADAARFAHSSALAHIYLVANPPHHPAGDFGLSPEGLALNHAPISFSAFTYSTIGLFRPALFVGTAVGQPAALGPLLRQAIAQGQVSAALYQGAWTDVGTPERLAMLNAAHSAAA